MCGIIGITSKKYIKNDLLKCLSNLEYRGYDSVGVYINKLIKKEGRVKDLIIPSYLDSKEEVKSLINLVIGTIEDEINNVING